MRRRRRIRAADLPRLFIGGVIGIAGLFSGRYARVEGANVYATDAEGRILVVRPTYTNECMLPGGRVERGETPHQAAVREAREETGLDVVPDRLVELVRLALETHCNRSRGRRMLRPARQEPSSIPQPQGWFRLVET